MKKLFVFGKGTLAELAKFYFERESGYSVCGFVVDEKYIGEGEERYLGLPLVSSAHITEAFPANEYTGFVAIGYSNMNRYRERKIHELHQLGYHLAICVSDSCVHYQTSHIGENCMIMEHVVLQPFSDIGDGCIVNAGVILSHGCSVSSNVFIGSGAVFAGNVKIGKNSFIGVGARVSDNVVIADYSLIGAGAYISKNTKPYGVYGAPSAKDALEKMNETEKMEVQAAFL